MSYDEVAIAALMSQGGPTQFLNSGGRHNRGKYNENAQFQRRGVYVGCVGSRFERPNVMEWRHIIVEEGQNTRANGYGPTADDNDSNPSLLSIWAKFYGLDHFPLFEEVDRLGKDVPNDTVVQDRFVKLRDFRSETGKSKYLDRHVYRHRMRMTILPFLCFANEQAAKHRKKAYIHVVGLGLGEWLVHPSQATDQVGVYA